MKCPECPKKKVSKCAEKPFISKRLKITLAVFFLVFGVSFLAPWLEPFNKSLIGYLKIIWWAVLLGLVIGGAVGYFVPDEFIFSLLGGKRKRNIFYAVFAGFLMSACSHGILAISMELYKKGAGIPSVIAFLLASPWANLPITILMFGFFGWKAVFFILAAMIIAVLTGLIYIKLEDLNLIEQSKKIKTSAKPEWKNIKNFKFMKSIKGIYRESVILSNMVLWWILIGVLLSAFIGAYIPSEFFTEFLSASFLGLLATLLFATIIEVCSEGSAPIAFEIFKKLGVFGNPFVFLMAGVVTDYTEIGLIWANIGKKTAFWLPLISVPMTLAFGMLFNIIL